MTLQTSNNDYRRLFIFTGVFFLYFLLHLVTYFHFGAQFIDDAYITFRYAERIAAGVGFTFNDGLPLLGTTTPLWTFLVAVGRGLGIELVVWVGILTSLFAAAFCFSVWRIFRGPVGFLGGMALLVYDRYLFNFLMGMETILYLAIVAAMFLFIARKRWLGIGFLGALAFLCRPDGAVIAGLGLFSILLEDRRKFVREFIVLLGVLAPWLVFSLVVFGSPVPHSIGAKQVIHPSSFTAAFAAPWMQMSPDVFFRLSAILAVFGVAAIVLKWRQGWPIVAWVLLYALGMGASRIQVGLFPWYMAPLAAGVWLLALAGLSKLRRIPSALQLAILVVVIIASSGFWVRNWRKFPSAFTAKEQYYLAAAHGLAPEVGAGDKVLVGEVGVFAYVLKDAEVIDSSGINSPDIYQLRKGGGGEDDGWAWRAVQEMKPDWIVSLPQFMGVREMVERPQSVREYELRSGLPLSNGRLVVLQRKKS